MSPVAVPRESVSWYPAIDVDTCIGDRVCVDFCKNEVYGWDEAGGHPVVERPYNCVLGCSACMHLCPVAAITFPPLQDLRDTLRRLCARAVPHEPVETAVVRTTGEGGGDDG
jgi:NAD-dependent dihydropyrimidine dehydrogenase PreA subunit